MPPPRTPLPCIAAVSSSSALPPRRRKQQSCTTSHATTRSLTPLALDSCRTPASAFGRRAGPSILQPALPFLPLELRQPIDQPPGSLPCRGRAGRPVIPCIHPRPTSSIVARLPPIGASPWASAQLVSTLPIVSDPSRPARSFRSWPCCLKGVRQFVRENVRFYRVCPEYLIHCHLFFCSSPATPPQLATSLLEPPVLATPP
jgi:hypothetical protein